MPPDPPEYGPARAGPVLLPPQVAPSEDLTWLVSDGRDEVGSPFGPGGPIEPVLDALARAVHRRRFPHALLVGERGVGKSVVVAEFARRAARGAFRFLDAVRVLAVDVRHVPPDESRHRLSAVLAHVAPHPDLVVALDGLAGLLRHGPGGSNKHLLLGALAHANCRLIGLLTPAEYDELAADDVELAEYFTRVDVPEPDPAAALPLVAHFARGLADRYGVVVEDDAVRRAVALTAGYVFNDHLPAKALKVLTRVCEEADYDRRQLGRPRDRVTPDDVARAVAAATGLPADALRGAADGTDYGAALREVIAGQDRAVAAVGTELGLIKAGMTDPSKPASVLMFLGPTGTGKTEMAKALARFYSASKRLKVYTLGNCVEPHSVATIIGVPPGYVGCDRPGRLVAELNADPYGVFLLDEADKAHPDVLQPFLNLFDEGWVVDQRGTKGYGHRAIFVLTTNVGQRMIADMHREGRPADEIAARMTDALSQIRHGKSDRPVFTPEFLARVKRVVVFEPLGEAAMAGIAGKLLADLRRGWEDGRRKRLVVPDGLAAYVGAAAHRLDQRSKGKEGGRVVRKLVAEWLEVPVQRAMAADPDGYRRATEVVVGFARPRDPAADLPLPDPAVSVRFG